MVLFTCDGAPACCCVERQAAYVVHILQKILLFFYPKTVLPTIFSGCVLSLLCTRRIRNHIRLTVNLITMNNLLNISATLEDPELLTDIVKQLAACRENDYSKGFIHWEWAAIDTSSTEAFVMGTLDPIHTAFNTSFFFTCIKEKKGGIQLEWSLSLS